MQDKNKFETFIDMYSGAFEEYLSSVVSKLHNSNSEYSALEKRVANLYEQYPKVKAIFDLEQSNKLSEPECKALIEILSLRNKIYDKQQESIYLRGCCDSIGYLKKAGVIQAD